MSTFVSVGNATQPFRRLLDSVMAIARDLPQPVFVQSGSTPFHAEGCECVPFLNISEFQSRVGSIEAADHARRRRIVDHCGAGRQGACSNGTACPLWGTRGRSSDRVRARTRSDRAHCRSQRAGGLAGCGARSTGAEGRCALDRTRASDDWNDCRSTTQLCEPVGLPAGLRGVRFGSPSHPPAGEVVGCHPGHQCLSRRRCSMPGA